jgi:hypothetical protein
MVANISEHQDDNTDTVKELFKVLDKVTDFNEVTFKMFTAQVLMEGMRQTNSFNNEFGITSHESLIMTLLATFADFGCLLYAAHRGWYDESNLKDRMTQWNNLSPFTRCTIRAEFISPLDEMTEELEEKASKSEPMLLSTSGILSVLTSASILTADTVLTEEEFNKDIEYSKNSKETKDNDND